MLIGADSLNSSVWGLGFVYGKNTDLYVALIYLSIF